MCDTAWEEHEVARTGVPAALAALDAHAAVQQVERLIFAVVEVARRA